MPQIKKIIEVKSVIENLFQNQNLVMSDLTKFTYKLKIIFFFVLIVSAFCFFGAGKANASGNVYGWAWTENIGWISFNKDASGSITGGGGSFDY